MITESIQTPQTRTEYGYRAKDPQQVPNLNHVYVAPERQARYVCERNQTWQLVTREVIYGAWEEPDEGHRPPAASDSGPDAVPV